MTAITSSGEDSIKKSLGVTPLLVNVRDDYAKHFEVEKCAQWINDNQFQRVALQIPDDLLHLSVFIFNDIASKIGSSRVYILADSTYGSCCIDEKTAAHINADALIHFGHSCGSSRKTKLPVLYIHVRPDIDKDQLATDFLFIYQDKKEEVGILCDAEYEDIVVELMKDVVSAQGFTNITLVDRKILENFEVADDNVSEPQSQIAPVLPMQIFYVTSTERSIINKILQLNQTFSKNLHHQQQQSKEEDTDKAISPQITIYNPSTSAQIQTPSIHKLLMKRNYYIEKLREAETVGILVGTLSVDNYIEVIKHLKFILKQAGKKSYVVSIGEINAPKLANFPDINVFVLVACPETSLIDSKEFYQVVVTPWEVEIAFGRQNDTAEYFVDYRVLLPGSKEHIPFDKYSARDNCLDVSLLNGVSRIGLNWQGLEELPADEFKIHEGQAGIAMHYESEPQLS